MANGTKLQEPTFREIMAKQPEPRRTRPVRMAWVEDQSFTLGEIARIRDTGDERDWLELEVEYEED